MRNIIDNILKMSIKLCLLTGVAFTFAACYAPATPDDRWMNEPDRRDTIHDQKQLDEMLHKEAEEISKMEKI